MTTRLLILAVCLAPILLAQSSPVACTHGHTTPHVIASPSPKRPSHKRFWIASWIAYAAVSVLDGRSSRGRMEANPLLRRRDGTFSPGRALLVKGLIGGGLFATQLWVIHKRPEGRYYKPFAIVNAGATGAMGAVAVHNYQKRR